MKTNLITFFSRRLRIAPRRWLARLVGRRAKPAPTPSAEVLRYTEAAAKADFFLVYEYPMMLAMHSAQVVAMNHKIEMARLKSQAEAREWNDKMWDTLLSSPKPPMCRP